MNVNRNRDFRPAEFVFNAIATIVLLFLIFSCGARKTHKSESEIKTETTTSQVKLTDSTSETTTEKINDIATDEIVVEAADSTKAVEVVSADGRVTKFKNARIIHKKKIDKSKQQTVNNTSTKRNQQVSTSTNTVEKKTERNTERKQFDFLEMILRFWWLWLLIVAAVYIYKKYFA